MGRPHPTIFCNFVVRIADSQLLYKLIFNLPHCSNGLVVMLKACKIAAHLDNIGQYSACCCQLHGPYFEADSPSHSIFVFLVDTFCPSHNSIHVRFLVPMFWSQIYSMSDDGYPFADFHSIYRYLYGFTLKTLGNPH